jgi:hypothetical protein
MHTHHRYHSQESAGSAGPAWFYGYHHDSGQMRMMTYPEYMNSMQTTYTKTMNNPGWVAQQWGGGAPQGSQGKKSDCSCGCREREECDCDCHCHVHCADAVEYARCGELRRIPITFENDTRRERDVTLTLGAFASRAGKELGWKAALSETTFTLPACGEKTVVLTVAVSCGDQSPTGGDTNAGAVVERTGGDVASCEVAYATLRAEGCRVRPLVIAVAVLPSHCEAFHADCGCGCC